MKNLILILAFCVTCNIAAADEVPVEVFAALPVITQPNVSPDGSKIAAMVRNEDGYYDIMVTPFGQNDFKAIASLKKAYDRIEWIHWANDERLLIAASKPENIATFRYRVSKLYSLDVNTGENLQLSYRGSNSALRSDDERRAARDDANVVSFLRDDPKHILVALPTARDTGPSVFKVNIYENTFDKVVINDIHVRQWHANLQGDVLLGVGSNPDKPHDLRVQRFWYRDSVDSDWQMLREAEVGEAETFRPVGPVDDTGHMFVISDYEIGREGLYRYNVRTGEFGELVFAPERHDLTDVIRIDGRIVGVTWVEDYVEQHYFDPKDAALSEFVQKTFTGAEVFIASSDRDRKKLVVAAVRDDTPLKYYLLDLEKGKASFWFSQYPRLEKVKLAKKQPFEYEARDGMPLNGYITLPVAETDGKPPLVVLPHGGPQARDTRYFDYWAQFLANRGYAVLQPNFRGSRGFGSAYEAAGYKEWGQEMQTDVLDAIAWVEEQGLADTENMCMVGASYGGYVALTASVQTPEKFQCFVSFAGISDLEKLVLGSERIAGAHDSFLQILIGNTDNNADLKAMRENSAIHYLERIARPVLLIHGNEDTRVRLRQSEDFYEKAERLGKDVEFILLEDGTHFLDYGPHRLRAFEAIEEFLDEHLK